MKWFISVTVTLLSTFSLSVAKTYYVSASQGNDNNTGTIKNPFRTVQKAADLMDAGDTCFVREGIIRETVKLKKSGTKDKPICFITRLGEKVTFSGTEIIDVNWIGYFDINRTWTADGEKAFQSQNIMGRKEYSQLYVDGEKMIRVNKPEELIGPGKWFVQFRDKNTRLVLWPPEEESIEGMEPAYNNPLNYTIEGKIRDYAFVAENVDYIVIRGIQFFAVTNLLKNCTNCIID